MCYIWGVFNALRISTDVCMSLSICVRQKLFMVVFHFPGSKAQKQIVLDGPVSCGKSIALAMLVQWAREENWLVLYVPKGREWTHGGMFYKNPKTDLWDTPVQAANILQARLI